MSASTSITTEAGGVLVVTHVIPAPQGAATQNSAEKKNHREQLLALGTVQIMIGLAVFLFELAMIPDTYTLGMYSGAFVWAPLFDILSGSLMVCAGTSMNKCRVNGGVGLSVVAAVASGAATTIYVLDVLNVTGYLFQRYDSNHPYYYYHHNYYNDLSVTRGVLCVLAVFSFLGFMVSICVTVLGCKASPQSPDQLIIMTNQSYEAASKTPETTPTQGALPRYEAPPIPATPPPSERDYKTLKPQEYNIDIV
ncbi:membrane-spanning 4-domains subfamily A member 15-like isoform X2 [Perca fluviatilis]|uniref:membrane-spanning 4-domains subfamily A member 15-like isoform X2 n=1 Tax=Perca fluviatilis TaxID=8168 RepID=UPI001965A60B|nr:membrane-spanning 4-domains subfamily A member 15-like isoform X2 [Perca fluviatilis]